MRAQRFISAVGSLCLAAGTAFGQPPIGPGPGTPPGAAFVPPGTGQQQLMPVAPGYGMLPQQGLPGLQSPPGDVGLEAYAGVGPQGQGRMLGTEQGQIPGIPQAWAMSVWNPSPYLIIRSEVLFLRSDFNKARDAGPLVGTNAGGDRRLAIQADVSDAGQFELRDVNLDLDTRYLVTPRLVIECFNADRCRSIEAGMWISVGPDRDFTLGNNDFPYFVTQPTAINFNQPNEFTVLPVTNAPAAFPDVVDDINVRYNHRLFNLEGMYWMHSTPEKGAVSDCAWGFGPRYFFTHEKIDVQYRNFVDLGFVPVGELVGRTKNDLWGVQFGAKATLQSPVKWIRSYVEGRMGLMSNDARHTSTVIDSNLVIDREFRWTRHQFSPLFEGMYNMEFFISQYVTAYAGFHVLYIDRVERAAEQFNSNFAVFASTQKTQSDILLFGPKIGFMMNW